MSDQVPELAGVAGGCGTFTEWLVPHLISVSLSTFYPHFIDLTGDTVTLFFYTFSRRSPSVSYPYGYGKFESVGTVGTSNG